MSEPAIPDGPARSAVLERVNLTYFLAARDAARESVPYAMAAFGLPRRLADWLAGAPADAVQALARMPVCAFAVRVPEGALARLAGEGALAPAERCVRSLHITLTAVGEYLDECA